MTLHHVWLESILPLGLLITAIILMALLKWRELPKPSSPVGTMHSAIGDAGDLAGDQAAAGAPLSKLDKCQPTEGGLSVG